jgi:hypothetical protein
MGDAELARRLAVHARWREAVIAHGDGMLTRHEDGSLWRVRVERGELQFVSWGWDEVWSDASNAKVTAVAVDDGSWSVPELSDPATQGCLWAMLRELGHFIRYESDANRVELHWHTGNDHHFAWEGCDTIGESLARVLLIGWEEAPPPA